MDQEVKAKLLQAVKNNINVPGLIAELVDGAANEALDKLVADSSTPFDDMAKAALYPVLSAELKKAAQEQWEKLFA